MNGSGPNGATHGQDQLVATASPTSTSSATTDQLEENMQAPARDREDDDEDAAASAPLLGVYGSQEVPLPEVAASPSGSGDMAHKRLLKGFCAYSVAGEVFAIVSASLFLPVVLETYARQNGVLATADRTTPCPPSGAGGAPAPSVEDVDGLRSSFSLMVYSASVAVQALTVISMGGLADDSKSSHARHRLLVSFAITGSTLCMLFLALSSQSPLWPISSLLALFANVTYGASNVCLNAYLPELGRSAPSVLRARGELVRARIASTSTTRRRRRSSSSSSSPSDTLLSPSPTLARAAEAYLDARARATGETSSRAIAYGYAAGIGVLVALLPFMSWLSSASGAVEERDGTWPLRVAVALSGLWWLVGTAFAAVWLRPRHEPVTSLTKENRSLSYGTAIAQGWRGLGQMLGEWRRLPQAFVFLISWFFLSDCFATITSTAVLFAKTSLNLPTSSLIVIAILSPLSGLIGALAVPRIQHLPSMAQFHLTTHRTLLCLVAFATIIPLWGLLALRSALQMYLLACVFGFIYGSFQAYARSCFADLIPPARSAQFFGLYSVTDKSSSFLGPFLVAVVTNATGEIRYAFWVILALMVVSLPVLAKVDVQRGSEDAERYENEINVLAVEAQVLPDEVADV
ncbi:Autophagy protein 22 [Rhodotorula mucilaginosa]|uniref:Autophagy-related protein n=1 Tax=Rhodotorula mucilaginosa TaxID=5537 RepID=A0A9P6W3V3_RHOMI|nr:Autophagy protein 22 [Rhodotorula mucilaginosa]